MFWLFELIRVRQWYKNLIIFLVISLGVEQLFLLDAYLSLFFGFAALCLMSSCNYIINDIVDREKDKLDKIKSQRPIASGKASVSFAIIIAIVFFVFSLAISYFLEPLFTLLLLILFGLTQLYSFWLKNKIFLDVVLIAINFMIRAIAGAVILGLYITEWFVAGIFFLAMFLVFAKRYGESKDGLRKNRNTLKFYTPELMQTFLIVFLSILVLMYSMYVIFNHNGYWFIATIPVFTYLLLRYFTIVITDTNLARHAEKLLLRKDLILGGLFFVILFLFALYKKKLGL